MRGGGDHRLCATPDRSRRLRAQSRFAVAALPYDAKADLYRCPAGAELRPVSTRKRKADGKKVVRHLSRPSVCRRCPLRQRCLGPQSKRREIERWEHDDVIDRHRARMRVAGEDMMRCRKALVEHPFGTLKCRARVPSLPGAKVGKGTRRVAPDGPVLQLQPGAAHPRPRAMAGDPRGAVVGCPPDAPLALKPPGCRDLPPIAPASAAAAVRYQLPPARSFLTSLVG